MASIALNIVKVGGSLFDHRFLGMGLHRWLSEQGDARHLFVPGGGLLADVIRGYHTIHGVSQEHCHWMAIRTLDINAVLLNSILDSADAVTDPRAWVGPHRVGILNPFSFLVEDERTTDSLDHDWQVTSDAIAARVAEVGHAQCLYMLKSVDLPQGVSWHEAARKGHVDPAFGNVVQRADLNVKWVNFRRYLDEAMVATVP